MSLCRRGRLISTFLPDRRANASNTEFTEVSLRKTERNPGTGAVVLGLFSVAFAAFATSVLNPLLRWLVVRTKLKTCTKHMGYTSRISSHQRIADSRGLTVENREKAKQRRGPSPVLRWGLCDLRVDPYVAAAGCENKAEELHKTEGLYLADLLPSMNWGGEPVPTIRQAVPTEGWAVPTFRRQGCRGMLSAQVLPESQ
jgi:hypothetical protein